MSLHWYACISTNTCCFEMHHISLEMDWWALPNASSIMWIRSAIHEMLADEAFIATDGLISQSFVVAFVHPTYVWIALIWDFPVQLSLWKSVYWLWRYKLNEVCNRIIDDPISRLPSQLAWLGMEYKKVQNGFWIKMISKLEYVSRIVLIIKLFFWMFCEKILKSFKIISHWHF